MPAFFGGGRRLGLAAKMGGVAFARSFAFPGVGQRAAVGSGGSGAPRVSGFERCCFQLVKRGGGNNRVTRGLQTECRPLMFSGGLIIQTKDRI